MSLDQTPSSNGRRSTRSSITQRPCILYKTGRPYGTFSRNVSEVQFEGTWTSARSEARLGQREVACKYGYVSLSDESNTPVFIPFVSKHEPYQRTGNDLSMRKGNLTPKTITAPLAAFTMACILFAYTRSSIRTARDQARYGSGSSSPRPPPPNSSS
ncbi:hypothetical protein LX36DRAFT_669622 [Colletotrichum falcatum]|nr:hypothetical protein LX36DRAFT_669622 [Colletotrichum falcatum]